MTYEVWAPDAGRVDVVIDDERHALESGAGGWWRGGPTATPGTDYAFSVDGGPPLPDPRSRHQPAGVHGPSRVVDLSDAPQAGIEIDLAMAVIEEIHVGTFSREGTFDGAITHLDHLVELGVTAVELMPVHAFPGVHGWGYDGVDLWAVHDPYGGPAGMRRFVDAAHERGLAVIVDVVHNHLGPDGNYLAAFGPYFTDRFATPWGDAVNLDGPDSDEVREFFVASAEAWFVDHGVDGLRLDAVHALLDTSAVHLLEELATRTAALGDRLGRRLTLIAESDLNDPRIIRGVADGGYGLDAQWADDLHHGLHVALTGERTGYYEDYTGLADVAAALTQGYVYDGRYSAHRRRRHGRPLGGLPGSRLVGCLQNHDQVGNRAKGERLVHLAGERRAAVGAVLLLTSPFVPMLFQGEEWGASTPFPYFTDHQDPGLAEAVRTGRRQEWAAFGWDPDDIPDPQDPATPRSAVLVWDERDREPHRALLDLHRDLIDLRRSAGLHAGPLDEVVATADESAGTIVVERGGTVVVANLGDEAVGLDARGATDVLLATDRVELVAGRVEVVPESAAVLRR
ncbi:MAG: malto-oligosyltrehalose trehalohydrolase [Actinomycetota bacterium]